MFYLLLWIMVLCLSFYLFKKVSGSMSLLTPNLISITFYYSLFSSSFIGSILIVTGIDDHYMIRLLSDDRYRVMGFLYICYIMIFFPLTMFIFNNLTGFHPQKEFKQYMEAPVYKEGNQNEFFAVYCMLTFLSVGAIGYTILNLDKIPILELFKGSEDLGALRIEASHNFQGNTLIRNIFGTALTPILSMITFVYFYQTKRVRWLLLFGITTAGAVFMQVYDLAKAPIFFYVIMFLLLLIYLKIIRLSWFKLAVLGGAGAALLIVMYVFIQGVTNPEDFLAFNKGPIGRIVLSQIAPFYLHLDLFTERLPLLNGQSMPSSIIGLYDMEQVRSARLAMEVFFPQKVEAGTAGVLNTLFAAEAYANFGPAGLLLGTIYIALFIQVIYMIFIRLPKNPLFLSLFIYFTINIPRVVIGGFTDFLLNTLWIAVLIVLVSPYISVHVLNEVKDRFSFKERANE